MADLLCGSDGYNAAFNDDVSSICLGVLELS